MDEYQQYERFDLDNDYEGGEFVGDEFIYRKKKEKARQTREQALYGDDYFDSDDEGGPRKRRRGREEDPADFSRPVSFRSVGVATSSAEKPEDVEKSELRPGLGGGGGGGGLGFQPAQRPLKPEEQEEEEADLPTAFGKRSRLSK